MEEAELEQKRCYLQQFFTSFTNRNRKASSAIAASLGQQSGVDRDFILESAAGLPSIITVCLVKVPKVV